MKRRRAARRSRELPIPVKLVFGLAVALVVLTSAELIARQMNVARAYQPDRIGGWHMLPAQDRATIRSHEGHTFRLSTNEDGLRTTLQRSRTPGKARVA
ncbi:MAG: hypothetical protein CL927_15755, partial [Deltaproteobacteria bacterium]|nr:hypothetical protein [Deltaproteobacteria bacterium]